MSRHKKPEDRWLSATEATMVLSKKAGRTIPASYVRSLVRLNKVEARPRDGRTNEYRATDVEGYVVQPRSKTPQPGEQLREQPFDVSQLVLAEKTEL